MKNQNPINKAILLVLVVCLLSIGISCKRTNKEIDGVWVVKKYFFGDIYAIDPKDAEKYVGKIICINNKGIDSNIFPFLECKKFDIVSKQIINAGKYGLFNQNEKGSFDPNVVKVNDIFVIKLNCNNKDFSELVFNNSIDTMYYLWDGVLFILERKS